MKPRATDLFGSSCLEFRFCSEGLRVRPDQQVDWGRSAAQSWFLAAEPCGAPAQVSPIPLEEPAHQNPVLLGGVCERGPSLCSRHRVA